MYYNSGSFKMVVLPREQSRSEQLISDINRVLTEQKVISDTNRFLTERNSNYQT